MQNTPNPGKLCECGCGYVVKTPSCRFKPGHFIRRDAAVRAAWVDKMRKATQAAQSREKLSKSLTEKWRSGTRRPMNPESRKKQIENSRKANLGNPGPQLTPEQLILNGKKVSIAHRALGEDHGMAKPWRLRSPRNVVYEFRNLIHFVRENGHLFDAEDVAWRRKPGNRTHTCRAVGGLNSISPRLKKPNGSWKGWRIDSQQERLFYEGLSLLEDITPASSNSPNSPAASPASRPHV